MTSTEKKAASPKPLRRCSRRAWEPEHTRGGWRSSSWRGRRPSGVATCSERTGEALRGRHARLLPGVWTPVRCGLGVLVTPFDSRDYVEGGEGCTLFLFLSEEDFSTGYPVFTSSPSHHLSMALLSPSIVMTASPDYLVTLLGSLLGPPGPGWAPMKRS